MMFKKFTQISQQISNKRTHSLKQFSKKNSFLFDISKRQKFIVSVAILSSILFPFDRHPTVNE